MRHTMVKNYWYAVSQSSLIEKKPLRLLRFELKLVLWRNSQGNLVCLEDRCAHRGTSLGLGKVVDGCIECPYHGFRYGSDGNCTRVPSNGVKSQIPKSLKVRSFPVRESNGIVWLWWGDPQTSYPELPWFNEFSDPGAPYVEISRETPISFCRGMEANLDFAHFYFVHRFFKIPGLGPVADPFKASVNGNLIEVQGNLRPEVNPQRKWGKSHETGVSIKGFVLFPGLAAYDAPGKNPQGERTFVAMSPITENKSWLLIRIYYPNNAFRFIYRFYWKTIFLKFLFPIIHQQDLRVIQEQVPQSSGLHSDLLVSCADQGITHYLRLWGQALKLDKDQERIRKSYVREA
jgi:phenylpropionate dioxygenase-like ring-hydroxylating dioxygenase large terminal subunit